MSVTQKDTIDAIGISPEGNELVMLITDHLDWEDEYTHLMALQDKLNAYFTFISSGQYKASHPKARISAFNIRIAFMFKPSENCLKLLDVARKHAQKIKTQITIEVTG